VAVRSALTRKVCRFDPYLPRKVKTMRDIIIELLNKKISYKEISRITGLCKGSISYYNTKYVGNKSKFSKRYNIEWSKIQEHYNQGHSIQECMLEFGIPKGVFYRALRLNKLSVNYMDSVKKGEMLGNRLVTDSHANRGQLKKTLIKKGLLKNECYICGQAPEWNGKELVMVIDHINGIHNDNRLENLRLLCPNCNSQTDTFSGRTKKYKSKETIV
jgi:hypothetical protein